MDFSDTIGQNGLKELLLRTVQDNMVAHATIFAEENGYGAFPLAMAFAQYISCEDRRPDGPCGQCRSCRKYSRMIHPDQHFVFPVNSSSGDRKLSDAYLEVWRTLAMTNPYFTEKDLYDGIGLENKSGIISVAEAQSIIRKLSLRPVESEYRTMLIWLPEKMNQEAANKLLKIMEEPYPGTYFIMVTRNPNALLPTVISRCRLIRVPPAETDALAEAIHTRHGIPVRDALKWARISSGSYSVFLEKYQEKKGESAFRDMVLKLFGSIREGDLMKVINMADSVAQTGREEQKRFCIYLSSFIRESLILGEGLDEISGAYPGSEELVRNTGIDPDTAEVLYEATNKAYECIEANVNQKLVMTDLFDRFYVNMRKLYR